MFLADMDSTPATLPESCRPSVGSVGTPAHSDLERTQKLRPRMLVDSRKPDEELEFQSNSKPINCLTIQTTINNHLDKKLQKKGARNILAKFIDFR